MAAAYGSLYGISGDPSGMGYEEAIDIIREWISDEMPGTLYYDVQSGYVDENEPQGFEDEETGEWIEPEWGDYVQYEDRDIDRIVFGSLVTDGGL